MSALILRNLTVELGGRTILDGVSLEADAGAIVAVVGPNGSGKTTLLDAISGTTHGARGEVMIDGVPSHPRGGKPRFGVGRVFQGSPLPGTLTVREVITLATGHAMRTEELLVRFGLASHETTFVTELSTGMRRILDLAIATTGEPKVLLLDEPSSGLARAEIERLAEVLLRLKGSGIVILLVEHDAWLVEAVADEVEVIDGGKIVARGSAPEILAAKRKPVRPHVAARETTTAAATLEQIARTTVPAPPLVRRSVSTWTILRLGLREFAAGLASVLILGVLSRVLHHELGISLVLVTLVLSTYNLAAPIGLPIGHLSDTRPLFGLRRVPYIIGGALLTGVAVAAAPHVAGGIGRDDAALSIGLSVVLFVVMGIGMYGAGTTFFALVADIASPEERGHLAKVIYLELLAGVFFGVALTAIFVGGRPTEGALPQGTTTLFAIAGVAIVLLTTIAVWGQERRRQQHPVDATRMAFKVVLRESLRIPQARLFFAFMTASTAFLFVQQGIIQPFGARVFEMSVAQTSGLSGMVTLGTITGMMIAGRPFAQQIGHKRVASYGLVGSALAFAALSAAAFQRSVPGTWLSLLIVGLCVGVFNVASLSLMMSMATRARAAFFMGAWTVAHALADGAATAGGGALYGIFASVTGEHTVGYGAVFLIEALGLALCIPLLSRVDPERFEREAEDVVSPRRVRAPEAGRV